MTFSYLMTAQINKGMPMGTVLAFTMAVTALSLPKIRDSQKGFKTETLSYICRANRPLALLELVTSLM